MRSLTHKGTSFFCMSGTKRLLALLLSALLLAALAAPAAAETNWLQDLEREWVYADTQRFVEDALEALFSGDSPHMKEIRLGDWYISPEGFAFRIPKGWDMVGRYKGATLLLVDESDPTRDFRASISMGISGEDGSLDTLTEERLKSVYAGQFQKFALQQFSREEMYGENGVRVTFVSGSNPQMLAQQLMFNKNGHNYVLMLYVENTVSCVQPALKEFSAFCGSLTFGAQLTAELPE